MYLPNEDKVNYTTINTIYMFKNNKLRKFEKIQQR